MRASSIFLLLAVALGVGGCHSQPVADDPGQAAAPLLGRQLDTLALEAIDGKEYRVADLQDKNAIVLAWTALDCPMSKVYLPRLRRLAAELDDNGVQFFLINSNSQDSLRRIHETAREEVPEIPVVRDRGAALARELGVSRTTAVLVLDQTRTVVYHGAVDDQYGYRKDTGTGASNSVATYRKDEPGQHYLRAALGSVLAQTPVSIPETDPLGCALGLRWTEAAHAEKFELNYHEDIEKLIQDNCQGCHHRGGSAPFALSTYRQVAGWSAMIREVVSERRMPPWNANPSVGVFKNDRRLTPEEINRITQWVDLGAPQGDPEKAPPPRTWPKGWQIGEPDVVLTTPEFKVPAEGKVPYRYVTVPANLEEDRWVEAAQVTSTNNEVVHHVLVFLKESRASLGRDDRPWSPRWNLNTLFGHLGRKERRDFMFRLAKYADDLWQNAGGGLFGYFLAALPGELPTIFPEDEAQFLPKGASLTFQIHYQPNGKEATSTTSLALKFRDEPPARARAVWAATSVTFAIPPGEANHLEVAKHKFQRGGTLLSLKPHMHVRGKSARYFLERRDGSRELLLDVPHYDFDWQHTYEFADPVRVEKGETLHFEVTFDNSSGNPYNPDPARQVYFGLQTDEEMLIGYFEAIWD